jgi:hypothetical protein
MDMQALSNFISGAQYAMKWILNEKDSSGKTYREKKTFYQAFRGLMQGASQLAGIPVYNALRDIAGLYHTFTGKTFGGKAYSRADRYEIMAEAYQEGNTEIYEKEMEKLLDFGVDEETVETGVRSKLRDQLKAGTGDEETYSKYLKEVTGWDDDKIQKSIQDTKYGEEKDSLKEGLQNGTVTEEKYIQFLMENYGMDEADATYAAIKAEYNATSEYAAVWNAVDNAIADASDSNRQALSTEVKRMIDLGKTKQSILNTLKNHYGDAYITAKANGKAADMQNILITALMSAGYSKNEAMDKINSWSD